MVRWWIDGHLILSSMIRSSFQWYNLIWIIDKLRSGGASAAEGHPGSGGRHHKGLGEAPGHQVRALHRRSLSRPHHARGTEGSD